MVRSVNEVSAEGTHYLYLTLADGVPHGEVNGLVISQVVPECVIGYLSQGAPDIRIGIQRSWTPGKGFLYYLHWDNGQDLALLDQAVETGAYTDADFEHSVKTNYVRYFCSKCCNYTDTLVIDHANPYPGAPELLRQKYLSHHKAQGCPHCGETFRLTVVKIIPVA